MPYRGLGSGIIRALQEEPNIKFINEPAGMQFISIIDRIADEGVNEDEGINEGINELESLILTFLEKRPGAKGYENAFNRVLNVPNELVKKYFDEAVQENNYLSSISGRWHELKKELMKANHGALITSMKKDWM